MRFLHKRKDTLRNPDGTMEFASYPEYLPGMEPQPGEPGVASVPPSARPRKHRYSQPQLNPEMPSSVPWTEAAVRADIERERASVQGWWNNRAWKPAEKADEGRARINAFFDDLQELVNGS
jgi:hypothetical protein